MEVPDKNWREEPLKVKEESDQPKPLNRIFREQVEEGLREYDRSNAGLLYSALAAGLELGFSLFIIGALHDAFFGTISEETMLIVTAFAYPLGFIFVILGRTNLFTEHTTLAVVPVLNGDQTIWSLLRIWGITYGGNLVGGFIMAGLLVLICPPLDVISKESFSEIASHFLHYPNLVIMGSAVLAGWLMGLLSWLITSAQETVSRIFIIIIITAVIGVGSLHHSIVGSTEVFAGMITSPDITLVDYLRVQLWATVGNIIGGVVFVSLLKFRATKN